MKIAFAGSRGVPAAYGGFETATEEIGARLAERGHDVTVYCRRGYGDEDPSPYRGMRKVYVPAPRLASLETLLSTCFALLHAFAHPPDVLIVLNPANGPLCIFPRLRRTPFALHVDGLDWERAKWPAWGRRYIYFAAWFATKIAPALIADSRGIQAHYRDRWKRDTHYASYGAEIAQSQRPELLEELDLKKDGYFLVVARLEPENHTDLIIEGYLKTTTDKPLVIVGDTPYASDYARKIKALGDDPRVRFLGSIYDAPRLRELLCGCYAYVHGHSVGGTNPVLLEALASGACVAYLDVDFNEEVVGDAGTPFPRDPASLGAALQELIDVPEKAIQCRAHAHERVAQAYTWERATDDYEALCNRLAKAKADSGSAT